MTVSNAPSRRAWRPLALALFVVVLGLALSACGHTPTASDSLPKQAIDPNPNLPPVPPKAQTEAAQAAWFQAKHAERDAVVTRAAALTDADVQAAVKASHVQSAEERQALQAIYAKRAGAPVFVDRAKAHLTKPGERARAIVKDAWTHGLLKPARWPKDLDALVKRFDSLHAEQKRLLDQPLSDLDLRMLAAQRAPGASGAPVAYNAQHISPASREALARVATIQRELHALTPQLDGAFIGALWRLAEASRVHNFAVAEAQKAPGHPLYTAPETALHEVVPDHPDYRLLRGVYARYHTIAQKGGFKKLPVVLRSGIRPGSKHKAIAALRKRLAAEGFTVKDADAPDRPVEPAGGAEDLAGDPVGLRGAIFDKAIKAQLEAFQHSRGLRITGELDPETLIALDAPVEDMLQSIELGLLRWHASASRSAPYHVRVNLARFQVQVVNQGEVTHRFKSISGRANAPTPRFNGTITHMTVYPWWWGIRSDPRRVSPGRHNPLGLLALRIDPRKYLIYLHGTNKPKLFKYKNRHFSAGCIRLEDPTVLAGILLDADPGTHTSADLERMMRDKTTRDVYFKNPVPVFLEYNTTFVHHESGIVHFNKDIYRSDARYRVYLSGRKSPIASWLGDRAAAGARTAARK